MTSRLRTAAPSLAAVFLTLALAAGLVKAAPAGSPAVAPVVAWPPSAGPLISEVMTGGSSASDEFVELYNAAPTAVDLAGDDVAYVTATGGTVTKKAGWATTQLLGPGQHLLIANGSGSFASQADMTYSGGLAVAGGSIVLRATDGSVIDALGWGTAANGFVEGSVAPAPPAGSSLERLPGGAGGNAIDTNDDGVDWFIQPVPDPQALADPPVLAMPGTPPPTTPTDAPTGAGPTTTDTPPPATATPSPARTAGTASPTEPASSASTPDVTPAPPTPTPIVSPGASATAAGATPTSTATSIVGARAAPRGTAVTITGVLTTPLGFTDEGHGAFVQDDNAGIALYLSGDGWPALPAGTQIRASGTTDLRYGQMTLRVEAAADLVDLGPAQAPAALTVMTGGASEAAEGLLIGTSGSVTGAPDLLSDGFAVTVDDGSGPLRIVAPSASGIGPAALAHGSVVALVGVLGQHAASSSGSGGYRLYLRTPADVQVVAAATARPSPGASGGPMPWPSGGVIDTIASLTRLGQHALVEATATSAGGVWGSDGRHLTVQDATGAILVRLPVGVRPPAIGSRVEVSGTLSHYLGAPELAADAPLVPVAAGTPVIPRPVTHAPPVSGWRWQLAAAAGTVIQLRRAAASWRAVLRLSDGSRLLVGAPAAARVAIRIATGDRLAITGIIRPPASGSSDPQLYLMARQPSDVAVLRRAVPAVWGGALVAPARSAASAEALDVDLADLPRLVGRLVRVGGVVVTSNATGLVLDDGTAEATVRLPSDAPASGIPAAGAPVTLVGLVVTGPAGSVAISLRSMADLSIAGDLVDGPLVAAMSPEATAGIVGPTLEAGVPATLPEPALAPPGLAVAALAMIVFVLIGAGGIAVRRRRAGGVDRAWRRRVAGRLAALRERPTGVPSAGRTDPARSPGGRVD